MPRQTGGAVAGRRKTECNSERSDHVRRAMNRIVGVPLRNRRQRPHAARSYDHPFGLKRSAKNRGARIPAGDSSKSRSVAPLPQCMVSRAATCCLATCSSPDASLSCVIERRLLHHKLIVSAFRRFSNSHFVVAPSRLACGSYGVNPPN